LHRRPGPKLCHQLLRSYGQGSRCRCRLPGERVRRPFVATSDRALAAEAGLPPLFAVLLTWAAAAVPARADIERADVPRVDAELAAMEAAPPAGVRRESIVTVRYYLQVASDLRNRTPAASGRFLGLASAAIDALRRGEDPLAERRGFVVRGYRSPLSTKLQGYSVHLSPSFDFAVSHPLMALLHGGSSNHHLFLSVVVGNNVGWATYPANLWTAYEPRWDPGEFILLAPNGFGQPMWRWMAERDVLDAIDDASRAYRVDPDRVFLGGVSNGGVGAYSIGFRHAWRFAAVLPMAGTPGWRQYEPSRLHEWERPLLEAVSAYDLAINAADTSVHLFHGRLDGGPMKPQFVAAFERRLRELDAPFRSTWYDLGHDIMYAVHRRGAFLRDLAGVRRDRSPARVRLASADHRAARQHWVEVAAFDRYPAMATIDAEVHDGRLEVATDNVAALRIRLEDVPLPAEGADLVVDGRPVMRLPRVSHAVPLV
ncbi:MAG: prolyl oligopeptidase family serine peptidase, partial [Myxococcota bacterium]|nr:prolyl oligopeptidase family serine peptidase [Myxococcota bacterium]